MARNREPQPYSYTPKFGPSITNASNNAAAAREVAMRAAFMARVMANTAGSGVTNPPPPPRMTATTSANANAGPGAGGAGIAPPGAARTAEDAVQDGGDAIDTFSSYVPTALPPCIVGMLRERAMIAIASKGGNDTSTAAAKEVSVTKKSTELSGTGSSEDVINLLDDSCTFSSELAASKRNDHVNIGSKNDVIEILDTDNEDSRMEMENDTTKTATPLSDEKMSNSNGNDASPTISNNYSDNNKDNSNNKYNNPTASSLFTSGAIQSHTSPAVESALLSSVSAPPVPNDAASIILPLVKEGKLSPLQAEGVTLAIQRFGRVFKSRGSGRNDGYMRAGFFIGDGAGIGKGRQISATILDSLCRNHGRGRHLWISVSRELVQDAKRDLSDVGCHVPVHDGAEVLDQMQGGKKGKGLGAGGSLGKGVLFVTYSLLVSGKRMEDIIGWLSGSGNGTAKTIEQAQQRARLEQSYTGVIVFDEAHKAKNLEADTRTAKLVLALQDRLPNARVLYCSATGVSDIKHMVYAARLGLWGSANPLYPTFDSFRGALEKRGVGAMEMLALEMKRKGIFLARTLSWDGAEFHTLEVKLGQEQIAGYDEAVRWWFDVKDQIDAALALIDVAAPKILWGTYWSAHQRFFREMCICAKIDEVTRQAKKYLENGDHAIIIGLQSTGEAGMEVALEELAESISEDMNKTARRSGSGKVDFEDMTLSGLVSTCASIMTNFVRHHFPIALPPPEVPKVPEIPPNGFASEAHRLQHMRLSDLAERIANEPPPKPIPALVARRDAILESIRDLDLPPNPLDDIIDRLGGVENVAEMTGRTGRILRNTKSGKYKYVKRFGSGPSKQKSYGLSMPVSREDENDRLNIVEKRKFMEGKKSVAIISDAASTGISLHADRRCKSNHKRRVHFTIELPWAADKAIQQLGRSHRSGQSIAPIYKMVVTELGGERRFASAVSKRMAQLGALTKGDRRAATGSDLSAFDIDSIFGRRALSRTYTALNEQPIGAPSRNSNDILDKFSRERCWSSDAAAKEDEAKRALALEEAANALLEVGLSGEPNVKKFLNRIAGLDVARQNLVFSLFMATLDDVVTDAKSTGEFEGSVEDIRASRITLKARPKVIAIDSSCGAKTELTSLIIDRGISFNDMVGTIIDGDEREGNQKSKDFSKDITLDGETNEQGGQCESGFYISRRKIAGRRLIMFAQRKVEKEDEIDRDFIDPLNLMIISRPNTGKNPCEMTSQEMRYKYKLLVSSLDLLQHIQSVIGDVLSDAEGEEKSEKDKAQSRDALSAIRSKWGTVAGRWDEAYDSSNFMDHNDGLAPRISKIGLITGAVLHILPSLEKAVQFMPHSQRSLRVMRVEVSDSGQRIVGIKFPVTEEAIGRLMSGMKEVANARQDSLGSPSFIDEPFSPIDEKAKAWATTERKTMKSFFGAASSKTHGKTNVNNSRRSGDISKPAKCNKTMPFVYPPLKKTSEKKQQSISSKGPAKKKAKTASISSFFGKKSSS